MSTIDEELGTLERDIRQLKIEYDQYFGGGRKRPPNEIEWRIDMVVRKYGERSGDMKIGQRFRFNNLTQTYAKYKDIFRKKLRQKEEGFVQRHFGAAAKAIEAQRMAEAKTQAAQEAVEEGATAVAEMPAAFRIVCSQPEQESEKVDRLFHAFVEAKKSTGEDIGRLSQAGFAEFVRKKTKDLQSRNGCAGVEYVVETVDGQVKLKALVKS